jgi:hypothetical protein
MEYDVPVSQLRIPFPDLEQVEVRQPRAAVQHPDEGEAEDLKERLHVSVVAFV